VVRTLQILRDVAQTIFRATDAFIGGVLFQQVINRQGLPGGSLLVTTTIGRGITPVIIPGAGAEGGPLHTWGAVLLAALCVGAGEQAMVSAVSAC
jgi:hypothetical protein